MIQQVKQLSVALQKCDNSWVVEQIVTHKIKNKRDNLYKKLPDKASGQGRPRPSASSSFNSALSSTVSIDEDDGNNLDDGSQTAEPHDDVASETSFQTTPVDLTTAAARRAEIKSTLSTISRYYRGRGRGRGARQQSAIKTQSLSMTQSFINEVPGPMERKPSRKVRENNEIEEVISVKRKADEELKEGRAKITKKGRADLEKLIEKWVQERGEVYEEVESEILWLGGVKFLGTYEGRRQIWTQAEPDDVEVDGDIED